MALSIAGRIISKRSTSKYTFYSLLNNDTQIIIPNTQEITFPSIGDIISTTGELHYTNTKQKSILPQNIQILSKNHLHIPFKNPISNNILKYSARHLDLLTNPSSLQTFKIRSNLIYNLRYYLHNHKFTEVETPILSPKSGGANATPFTSQSKFLNKNLYLRVSPELYLKKLIIGGFTKIFEIGKQFRNEDMDGTHNPEFTTCECYHAFTDLEAVMADVEKMLRFLVSNAHNTEHGQSFENPDNLIIEYGKFPNKNTYKKINNLNSCDSSASNSNPLDSIHLDFSLPFKRIYIIPELEKQLNIKFTPDSLRNKDFLIDICKLHKIKIRSPFTVPRLLDSLISHFIEPNCIQPTFVCGHPSLMSPLAKDSNIAGISDRFELYIGGKEIMNGYAELDDPFEQEKRFQNQVQDRNDGDLEAQPFDADFIEALKCGMPPTVGWGLGIDRLCMILANTKSIKDVITFPLNRVD